jgi:shikimate dehydrogenase
MVEQADRPVLYAVLGHPIAHSLSPAMHRAGFARSGRPHCYYIPIDVDPESLADVLAAFRRLGGHGLNLTRPLKEVAFRSDWLRYRDPWAERAGAVNTLVWREDAGWHGFNTDAPALAAAVAERMSRPERVLIFGGGGVARASHAAFADSEVTVAARRPVDWARWIPWVDGLELAHRFDVVVNATPLGQMGERGWDKLPAFARGQGAVDWVYAPRHTPFLSAAAGAGAWRVDGLELLARQAALAWIPWFGQAGDWQVMLEAVR